MPQPKITSNLTDFTRTAIESYFEQFFTTLVCKVEAYDVEKQEADLKPVSLVKVFNAEGRLVEEELPVLANIPVAFPRAGDWFVSWPVSVGDTMTVLIATRDYSDWRENGIDRVAEDVRVNPLNAAIALPNNIYAKSAALSNAHSSKMVIGKDTGARIYISDDEINIYEEAAAEYVALAQKTFDEINTLRNAVAALTTFVNTHTHTGVTTGLGTSGTPSGAASAPSAVQSVAAAKVKAT